MSNFELKIIRWVLALIWLVTGLLSLGLYPVSDSLVLLSAVGLTGGFATVALYSSALLDITFGILTLSYPKRRLWQFQAGLILGYTVVITFCLPQFWLYPFGPILKNLPILVLLWLLYRHKEH